MFMVMDICGGSDGKELPGGSDGKESVCTAGDPGSIPGLERSPGGENRIPLQYSGEFYGQRGAWWVIVHVVAKSWTRLSD